VPTLDLAEVVRFHRRAARLTQAELAALAGVGKTSVFDVEHGKRSLRLTTLLAILGALGIRLEWDSRLRAAFDAEHPAETTP
jgi:y4mF family transcriptional regulator